MPSCNLLLGEALLSATSGYWTSECLSLLVLGLSTRLAVCQGVSSCLIFPPPFDTHRCHSWSESASLKVQLFHSYFWAMSSRHGSGDAPQRGLAPGLCCPGAFWGGGCHAPHCCLSFLGTQVLALMFHGLEEPPGTCCWYLNKFIKFRLYGQLVGKRTQT